MAEIDEDGLGLIRGDARISRFLFGSPSKRRSVEKLKEDGWPIFDCAGKNTARPDSLRDEVVRRERASVTTHDSGKPV
jgi:hypothetical protein